MQIFNPVRGIAPVALLRHNQTVNTADVRRKRLERLIAAQGLSALAATSKKPPSQLLDMCRGRKAFGEKVARELEARLGLPALWFDDVAEPGGVGVERHSAGLSAASADFALLLESDQQRIIEEIKQLADVARAYQAKFGGQHVPDARVAQHIPPAPAANHPSPPADRRRGGVSTISAKLHAKKPAAERKKG